MKRVLEMQFIHMVFNMGFKRKKLEADLKIAQEQIERLKEYIWNICELIHLQPESLYSLSEAQDNFVRDMDCEGLYDIKKVEEDVAVQEEE